MRKVRSMQLKSCLLSTAYGLLHTFYMISDLFRLDGKVSLVTGSATGIGASIAVALAHAGAAVACHGNSRSADETCQTIAKLDRETIALSGDLADRLQQRLHGRAPQRCSHQCPSL